ncbi:ribosome-binding protein [Chamberlinius hualienensis]
MDELPANFRSQITTILCCKCGIAIEPNPANMCMECVRSVIDITEGIPKQCTIYFCKGCERYLQPPTHWITCCLESRELLQLCLKKLKNLNKVRLVDASFVWTEPHSKRIKVKLTVEKEVLNGAIMRQVFIVEYVVNSQMCDQCHRFEAKDFWKAVVQVRQMVNHKKTFYYLEQRILKHKAHENTLNIKAQHSGLDFYFASKDHARKFTEFLVAVVPCRYQTSQQLISHDVHSNVYNYKTTFSVEIVPICKDDLVCLPLKLAKSLGSIGQLCICARIQSCIHLLDPKTGQTAELTSAQFWRDPFAAIGHTKQYNEYILMDIENGAGLRFAGQGRVSQKLIIADAYVVRPSELGVTEVYDHCKTHLGHILKTGDSVSCFDLANANINDPNFEKMKVDGLPSVVIIKKMYGDKFARQKRRKWKLKHIIDDIEDNEDFFDFIDDVDEDPKLRQDFNIYKDPAKFNVESDAEDDMPKVSLEEMLDDLHISVDPAEEDEDEESMIE